MSLISENVIPGNHGKVFGTNANTEAQMIEIQSILLTIEGVKDAIINNEVYPKEITVHTNEMVKVIDIENKAKSIGFHVIPKNIFSLK